MTFLVTNTESEALVPSYHTFCNTMRRSKSLISGSALKYPSVLMKANRRWKINFPRASGPQSAVIWIDNE